MSSAVSPQSFFYTNGNVIFEQKFLCIVELYIQYINYKIVYFSRRESEKWK